MPYLIDGHNLIPRVRGLSLDQLDDETRLVDMLEAYFRRIRKKAVVYFDRGQPGLVPTLKRGFVTAHFIRPPLIADQAIRGQLRKLGGSSKNYTVVSSDNKVIACAQRLGARTLSNSEFADLLAEAGKNRKQQKPGAQVDTDYWLGVFGEDS